ncbi:MAG TPA: class I SAM-dependent methyltransferase [Candidatus Sulfotelmatobacter sp.]|nr:class I SAM-dependent methyltransferase [Candidatus Sulfotelmatobacter sp.]
MSDSPKDRSSLEQAVESGARPWTESPFYERAEPFVHVFWNDGTVFRRLFDELELDSVLELACGHGRQSAQLVERAQKLVLMDVIEENVEFCKKRFQGQPHISFVRNNGHSFQPVQDGSLSAIVCYDSMVHFAPEVVAAYLIDAARVLRPGGKALLHHSNYSAAPGKNFGLNPHARNHMSKDLFAAYANEAGLEILESVIIPWAKEPNLDCVSLLRRPRASAR